MMTDEALMPPHRFPRLGLSRSPQARETLSKRETERRAGAVRDGLWPSGLPHIGTFQEVLRTTLVRRAYEVLTGCPRVWWRFRTTWTVCARCPTMSNKAVLAAIWASR
jgi:lysyl-tRNA synthetase class 1